jgi:hypothetical protein
MLIYGLVTAYAAVAAWYFWIGVRGGARVAQGILVSLLWPLAIVLVSVLLLADDLPEDA